MKAIIKYQAHDGREFPTDQACISYEGLLDDIAQITSNTLGPRPDDMDFASGKGYIQHTPEMVQKYQHGMEDFAEQEHKGISSKPFGYIGRCLSDGRGAVDAALYDMWYRLYCIDDEQKEWGQPFYALNAGTGKQIKLR